MLTIFVNFSESIVSNKFFVYSVFELEVKLESNPPDLVKDIEQSCSSLQNEILNLESEIKASERL